MPNVFRLCAAGRPPAHAWSLESGSETFFQSCNTFFARLFPAPIGPLYIDSGVVKPIPTDMTSLQPSRSAVSRRSSNRRAPQTDEAKAKLRDQIADNNPAGVPPASSTLPDQPEGVVEEDDDATTLSNPAGQSKRIQRHPTTASHHTIRPSKCHSTNLVARVFRDLDILEIESI